MISYYHKYRIKQVILEFFDEMLECERPGKREASFGQYQTRLNPPPADPNVAHRD